MIDPATVQLIKDTADIVEVVSDYVHLTRRGANYMGLCPFHNERTPSFSVNKARNFCFCFSCKKGGSPVNFIMEKEGLTYHEALLHLAKKYNIEVKERELSDEERERQSAREAMLVANEWAMKVMEADMRDTEEGRDVGLQYFRGRGVTDEAIRAFHLGYALDKGDHLVKEAVKAGYNRDVLKTLGLIGTSQQGRDYDRFRGRVIFPIINSSGKIIAFGGRDLKGGLAKYINSPESDLYKKSDELYGIFQARSSILKDNKCFLVEGYMDVIGMWQAGLKNVVASSGTALTDGQIAMIHRFTENITLIYDGDAPGIKAALRGIDMLLSHRLKVKVLLLPDGEDPDSFARTRTPEEFRKYVEDHETDVIRFKARVLLNDVKNDPQRRIAAVSSVVESIAHIPDPLSRDVYIQECSNILNIPDTTIAKSVARSREAILEKMRRERERKNIDRLEPAPSSSSISSTSPSATAASAATTYTPVTTAPISGNGLSQQTSVQAQPAVTKRKVPLSQEQMYPIEMPVIRYCVRYGFLDFCERVDNNPEAQGSESTSPAVSSKERMSVVDFISDELALDEMSFSIDIFNRILMLLKEMQPRFKSALMTEMARIERDMQELRKKKYEEIGASDLSISEIEKAEKEYEEELAAMRDARILEFTKDFPGRELASHEDDEIRDVAGELIREKHHLSNIYTKAGNAEPEESRLISLVPRALMVWKNELLNNRLKELLKEFHEISINSDPEREHELQSELNNLMQMRAELAKDIGDRIIRP